MNYVEESLDASQPVPEALSEPKSLGRLLCRGSSALGLATLLERGFGFFANLAAARVAGAHAFGAYSIAMTTANNVASYAGAGIGTTANRFSGEYPYESAGYRGLLRALSLVCLGSSTLAAAVLWLTARPLATYLIRNPGLAPLLRLASISAGAMILLECLRGLLVGQRRFKALLTLSVLFGLGMAALLPMASRFGPSRMVSAQALVAFSAIGVCVLAAKKLQFSPGEPARASSSGPSVSKILRFGMVQFAGTVGLNAAGWWIASMVARADSSLVQAGWFSIAMQLRNISSMPGSLISQTAYAQLTDSGGEHYGGPDRVTAVSTVVASAISIAIAGVMAAAMPWLVPGMYGKDFAGAELAVTLAVATGLIHMSAAPAAARLTVVSLPYTGVINGIWSVLIVILATMFVPDGGGAAAAAACFLVAHLFSAVAVLVGLWRRGCELREVTIASLPAFAASASLAVLCSLRAASSHKGEFAVYILIVTAALLSFTYYYGGKISPSIRAITFSSISRRLLGLRSIAAPAVS